MQRLGATIRWAPTSRQHADALTKDAADPVDLLRFCMRSGEYQLSREHIILERAAAERSRRKQRQTSSQSSSLQRAIRLIKCIHGSTRKLFETL